MLHPRAIGRSPLRKDDGHRERDGDRVRMRVASAPSAARAAARRVGTREIIRGAMPQASASTPRRVKREIIRGAMPQASASTPSRGPEREFIRDKTRASTVVGQSRWGYEPWVIIRGEGTRASAARWRSGKVGREGALAIRDILNGSKGLPRDTGMEAGSRRRRVPVAGRSHTARLRRADLWAMRLMGLLWFRQGGGCSTFPLIGPMY